MLKRLVWTTGGLGLLATFLLGRDACSYVSTSMGWVKDSVKNTVPVGFEIDRARKMVHDLLPDIRKNMHVIAQEEAEVERLTKQIAQSETQVTKEREELLKLKGDLTSGQTRFMYEGRTYTEHQVRQDLANRFERFKTHEATLNSLRDILTARQQGLVAARGKLESTLAQKRNLEVQVENLEAQMKMVEVAQTSSQYHFDDSQLGRVKELISDLQTRLKVEEKMVNVEAQFHDEIPVTAPAPDNIIEQIGEYFGPADASVAASIR